MRLYPRAAASWKTYRSGRIDNELPIIPTVLGAFPEEVADRLEPLTAPLVAEGFVHARDYGPRDYTATVVNHARVYSHPVERIRAWVMDFETETAMKTVVELATRLPDGTIINTLNPTTPAIFDQPPWIQRERLPGASVEELLAVHRARTANLAVTPAPPWDEDALTTAQRENAAILAYQADRGVLTPQPGGYGYTGRGALRSVHRVANAMPTEASRRD